MIWAIYLLGIPCFILAFTLTPLRSLHPNPESGGWDTADITMASFAWPIHVGLMLALSPIFLVGAFACWVEKRRTPK